MTTIRRDLVKAASLAKDVLGESTRLVADFLQSQINPDGGFKGRSSDSDLYYTMFGTQSMLAVCPGYSLELTAEFLKQFDAKLDSMELVDLGCYFRIMADISNDFSFPKAHRLLDVYSTPDGGYNGDKKTDRGTAYGCFLALGAFQDSGLDVPDKDGIIECINSLKVENSGFSNEFSMTVPSVPATAAAVSVLHYLGGDIDDDAVKWLLAQVNPEGGFVAMENAPVADLLSTATGLFALRLLNADISNLREQCLDFVDSLWDGKGGFAGNSFDKVSDCEYTFYGLLALGLLSQDD